jgi:tetratricopeptide (TPR) repeat protein/AraC-like DNA-binding protein
MIKPDTSDPLFISNITEVVLRNLGNEKFGVKELALELKLSHYRLSRKLFNIKGQKVNQFIREVRLKKSLELLKAGNLTASEVAYYVGFSSPAYFSTCFHDYFGYPPGKVPKNTDETRNDTDTIHIVNETNKRKPGFRLNGYTLLVILIPVILALTASLLLIKRYQSELLLSEKRITITVFPFQNRTNDTLWNVWEEGIQESLISWLANSRELRVIRKETLSTMLKAQSTSTFVSINPNLAEKISNDLDAGIFLYGSIKEAGQKVKLDAELISTKNNEVLTSFEIDVPPKKELTFEIIDSLRKKVTNFLLISELITQNSWLKNFPRISTNSPEALKYYIYGYRAYYKADWAVARNWFLKAISVDSNYYDAMSRVYFTYKNQGMMDQGLPWLIKVYNKADDMPVIHQLYMKWSYAEIFESPDTRIKYLRELQEIDDQGNYYYLIGSGYVKSKRFARSIPEFEKYLDISRQKGKSFLQDNWVYPALGEVYHLTGQYRKAKKLYREAWKVNTDHTSTYFSWIIRDCGSLALAEEDTAAANRYIKEFISVRKEKLYSDADISEGLGDMYWLAEKWDQGVAYYREALSLDPENPERMNILAYHLIERNSHYDEVTDLMNRALERATSKFQYYNYLDTKGYNLYKQGGYNEALSILQKVWDETPFKIYTLRTHLEEVKKSVSQPK